MFGKTLKAARISAGDTQPRWAQMCRISLRGYQFLEAGHRGSSRAVRAILAMELGRMASTPEIEELKKDLKD